MAGGAVGLILGAAFGGFIGDRFHHEHDARVKAEESSELALARAKTLETRLAANAAAAAQAGAAPGAIQRSPNRAPCEIKPVMTDEDLLNCGASPR